MAKVKLMEEGKQKYMSIVAFQDVQLKQALVLWSVPCLVPK